MAVPHCTTVNGKRIVTREYSAWQMLKNRCLNRRCVDYGRYGAKGAKLDERWHSYLNFLADMGPKPSPDCSIRRHDDALPFNKDNCYWGPPKRKVRTGSFATYDIPEEFRKWASR